MTGPPGTTSRAQYQTHIIIHSVLNPFPTRPSTSKQASKPLRSAPSRLTATTAAVSKLHRRPPPNMSENASSGGTAKSAGATGSGGGSSGADSTAGLPFYQKQRQHLRELIARRKALDRKLVRTFFFFPLFLRGCSSVLK